MKLAISYQTSEEPIKRSISLTNEQWLIVAQCVEAFSETYRTRHSEVIATYVTRKQLSEAQKEAQKMNDLLRMLDEVQSLLL
jgi:adenine C2-methylase RlmN of 23S rRNA A2503 and tRNA A37